MGLTFVAGAQNPGEVKRDVIYLKTGNILVGEIEALFPDSIVKIRLDGGSYFELQWDEIERIVKEYRPAPPGYEFPASQKNSAKQKGKRDLPPFRYIQQGYLPTAEANFLGGQAGGLPSLSLQFQTIHYYHLKPVIAFGMGIAGDRYVSEYSVLSVFAGIRGDLLKEKPFVPCYFLKGGYGFYLPGKNPYLLDYHGGPVVAGGLGIRIFSRFRQSYLLGMGYQYQSIYRSYELWDWNGPTGTFINENRAFRRIVFQMGMTF